MQRQNDKRAAKCLLMDNLRTIMAYSAIIMSILTAVPASAGYPSVRNFSKSDYTAGTQNWDITQGSGKMLYFANNNGMLEFDGNTWEVTPVSNYTNVRSILYDRGNSRIWAGAFNEFGYFALDSTGKMTYVSMMAKFSHIRDISEIWKIVMQEDALYLQGDNAVYRYSSDTVRVFDLGTKINCLTAIGNKVYASAVGKGVMTINDGVLEELEGCEAVRHRKVRSILPYIGNALLMITEFDGVFVYQDKTLRRLPLETDARLKKAQTFCAASDGRHLAIGTVSDGVFIIDLQTFGTMHLNIYSGLQNNSVLSMFFDAASNLWLGLDKGIDLVTLNSPEMSVFSSDKLYGTGYASAIHDGKLYLGTNQGLYYTQYSEDAGISGEIMPVKGIKGQVWCLKEAEGTLLCGHDHGMYTIDGDMARRIDGLNGIWNVEECPYRPGEILGCSYDGLFTMRKDGGQWIPQMLKGFSESSGKFEAEEDGTIWLHHWIKGLFRLTLNQERDSVVNVEYFSTDKGLPTGRNNMTNRYDGKIVFSSEGGWWTYSRQEDRMKPFVELNRLFSRPPVATVIDESPYGDLLFLSGTMQTLATNENGKYSIDSLSLKFLQNKRIPGFDNITWLDREHFIINTEDGFSLIDTGKLKNTHEGSGNTVFIKNIFVTSRGDSLIFGARTCRDYGNRLKLPYRDNSLRFEFVCPQFSGKDAVKYSWILEGYDKDWSEWTGVTSKEYTGLPYGNYIFRVKAMETLSADMSECRFNFSILPPWYRSRLAVGIYAMVMALAVYLLIRYMNLRADRQALALEKQKEEEMREQQSRFEAEAREREQEIVLLKNRTLEADLRHKSQDLANSAMNLIRKNEILIKIKNDIAKVQSEISENEDKAKALKRLHKIQSDIRENIDHDDDWQKFEQNFDKVYEDYLKRLKKEFPKLTGGDMRLCAYLKMNLSSKDIASMMNVSVRSVEMARYRLRIKMGLSRETNLSEYLGNF